MTMPTITNRPVGERRYIVKIQSMGETKQFLPENLETYQAIWSDTQRELRPEIFGDECVGGLRWSTTEIIPMDRVTCARSTRAGGAESNPAAQAITSFVVNGGWDLREVAICVSRDTTDSPFDYVIRDGRSRYLTLAGLELKNVMCEVFDHVNPDINPDYFSFFMNY